MRVLGMMIVLGVGCVTTAEPEEATTAQEVHDPGKRLFEEETFGGNGRTCATCHGKKTGTLSLEDIDDLFRHDPTGPLFRGDGTDDGGSAPMARS
jgi:cytochrome c peroxidase